MTHILQTTLSNASSWKDIVKCLFKLIESFARTEKYQFHVHNINTSFVWRNGLVEHEINDDPIHLCHLASMS